MPETYSEQAIVLNRRPWRDHDYTVSVYTRTRGKLQAVARGALRPQSRLAAHLEPLTLVEIMVISGRIDYIGGAVSRDCYSHCKSDIEKTLVATKAIATCNRWLKERDNDPRIFRLLSDFLAILNQWQSEPDWYQWLSSILLYKVGVALGFSLDKDEHVIPNGLERLLEQYEQLTLPEIITSSLRRSEMNKLKLLLTRWLTYIDEEVAGQKIYNYS